MVDKVQGYKSKKGDIFPTLNDAITADLVDIAAEETAGRNGKPDYSKFAGSARLKEIGKKIDMPDMVLEQLLETSAIQEIKTITHWVLHRAHVVETLTNHILEVMMEHNEIKVFDKEE